MTVQQGAALIAAIASIATVGLGLTAFLGSQRGLRHAASGTLLVAVLSMLTGVASHLQSHDEWPAASAYGFFSFYVLITLVLGEITARRCRMTDLTFVFQVIPALTSVPLPFLSGDPMIPREHLTLRLELHLVMVLLSLATFTLAASAGALLFWQDLSLKKKRGGFLTEHLPAIDVLDHVTFRQLGYGFLFLTAGVILGFMSVAPASKPGTGQSTKIVLGVVAWGIFAYYLQNRVKRGWRGRTQAYFALAGFLVAVLVALLAVLGPR